MTARRVLVVGPLPPPTQGQSLVTQALADALSPRADVRVFDLSGDLLERSARRHLRRVAVLVPALLRFVLQQRRGDVVYVSVDQGLGRLFALPFLVLARARRAPVVLHHHSYSYLGDADRLAALTVRVLPAATHVFLCADQAARFAELYGAVEHRVLSNACFHPPRDVPSRAGRPVVGMLGNLTRHKGVDLFVDVAERCRDLDARFVVAGPAEADVRELLAGQDAVEWVGPVYGADKDAFLGSLDVFAFPSRYAVETQPLVVFEAAAYGTVPVTVGRGCLRGDVELLGGVVLPEEEAFVEGAAAAIRALAADPESVAARRRETAERYVAEHRRAAADLEALLDLLAGAGA